MLTPINVIIMVLFITMDKVVLVMMVLREGTVIMVSGQPLLVELISMQEILVNTRIFIVRVLVVIFKPRPAVLEKLPEIKHLVPR